MQIGCQCISREPCRIQFGRDVRFKVFRSQFRRVNEVLVCIFETRTLPCVEQVGKEGGAVLLFRYGERQIRRCLEVIPAAILGSAAIVHDFEGRRYVRVGRRIVMGGKADGIDMKNRVLVESAEGTLHLRREGIYGGTRCEGEVWTLHFPDSDEAAIFCPD